MSDRGAAGSLGQVRPPQAYEPERAEARQRLAEHRRDRRLALGDVVSLVIEDRETLRGALEEALRAERVEQPDRVAAEAAVVATALPGADELCALLVLEIADPAELGRRRAELRGLHERVRLELDGVAVAPAVDASDAEGSVLLLRFRLAGGAERVRGAAEVSISVEHPAYRARTLLTSAQREAIAASVG
ncbi:MAG: DUF3501 family protein [Candidatus Dormibacteria bacterium]